MQSFLTIEQTLANMVSSLKLMSVCGSKIKRSFTGSTAKGGLDWESGALLPAPCLAVAYCLLLSKGKSVCCYFPACVRFVFKCFIHWVSSPCFQRSCKFSPDPSGEEKRDAKGGDWEIRTLKFPPAFNAQLSIHFMFLIKKIDLFTLIMQSVTEM